MPVDHLGRLRTAWNHCAGIGIKADADHMGANDVPFLNRLLLHYGIYRRYPLRPWPALKNAWRVAWR